MSWSLEDIQKKLLGQETSVLAVSPDLIIEAVNRVERVLGHGWIVDNMPGTGIAPAMQVIGMGLRLAALDGLTGTDTLLSNLRRHDQSAEAELTAIYLIRDSSVELELEPAVGDRKADFRARKIGETEWTTVEVTQAATSDQESHLREILQKLLEPLAIEKKFPQFSLDVVLRRKPTATELDALRSELPAFCCLTGQQQKVLDNGLGFALLNHTAIMQGQPMTMSGIGPTMGIIMFVAGGPNQTPNHKVSVQIPFTDQRAEEILRTEAKQLSKDGIGLVMINASGGRDRFDGWDTLIRRRFQPTIHTRVSGVCMFDGSMVPNGPQYDWLVQARLLLNEHARHQLPSWIQHVIAEAGERFDRAMKFLEQQSGPTQSPQSTAPPT